ncbi:MAG: alpha-N-acetylglucosaminidase, partial [Bacteroides sp.]|nr:alpha-N-acetylglucosaminidase [Bacteroides sp.]
MKKILLSMLAATAMSAFAADLTPIDNLARRVVPTISDQIIFEEIEAPVDTFSISGRDGKVLIKGNSPISMAVGLNNYLRRYMGANVSWYAAEPVQISGEAVVPTDVYGARAAVPERFFLNYCTFGYTMPYWQWQDWERFIDWMALNGINLPLAMTGQEKAWYLTWKKLGLTDEEILSSFTGPAHLPWHWMNNVDHFQGPLTIDWLNSQENLQKQILGRERELGMKPVLAAFAGHAPVSLKKHYPDANITLRSDWANFPDEDRCYFLDPSDPLYGEVQKTYLAIQDSIFGTDHIYGIDP